MNNSTKEDKEFIKLWDKGFISLNDCMRELQRYGVTLNRLDTEVMAGIKSEINYLYGGIPFTVKMFNGDVESIVRHCQSQRLKLSICKPKV